MHAIALHHTLPQDWDRLVTASPAGTFYQSSANLELIAGLTAARVRFFTVRHDGRLAGGLAFACADGPLGVVVNSLPYYGSYGEALIAPGAPKGTAEALYGALLDHCRELDALCLTVITSPFSPAAGHAAVGELLHATFTAQRICHATPLPQARGDAPEAYFERIFALVAGRARTAYRKATQLELALGMLETEADATDFSAVHKENIGGKGGLFKHEAFFNMALAFSLDGRAGAQIAVAQKGSAFAGGAVFFAFNRIAEYHTVALRDEFRSSGALNKVIIDKMAAFGQQGAKWMNFGGTWRSQDGVRKFKESFGAVELPYSYHTAFFRGLDTVRGLRPEDILAAYPHTFVIPFSELP